MLAREHRGVRDFEWPSFGPLGVVTDRQYDCNALAAACHVRVLLPLPLPREELIEIVRRIIEGDLRDQEYYLLLLDTNVVFPGVSGLIFYPPPELVDASPTRIVDAALDYQPIAL